MKKVQISEFRKDIVSGEWTLVSSLLQKKPLFFANKNPKKTSVSKEKCPFEDPKKNGNPSPILWYPKPSKNSNSQLKDWFVQIIPNKYPVLLKNNSCPSFNRIGPYKKIDGFGFHEVIITRHHNKDLKKMSVEEVDLVLKAYKERYKMLEKDKCVDYILIFHNHGELAGASIEHPHSQLVALPIIPPDVSRSIYGGLDFFQRNKKCVHCVMIESELKEKKRIVYKNKYFIIFVPYASRVSYEMRIFPLKHSSDFEEISDEERGYLAEALKDALTRMAKTLNNPDYNFFVHTASAKVKDVPYYHWHIEILPKTYKWAGLELGSGIDVVAIPPEEAATNLRAKN